MPKISPFLALCLAVAALALGGCGSDSSGSTSFGGTASTAAATGASKGSSKQAGGESSGSQGQQPQHKQPKPAETHPKEPAHFKPPTHHDSGGGVKPFESKAGDNSVQESGEEASSDDLAEAAATLHAFLDARAARAWKVACAQMSSAVVEELVSQLGSSTGKQAGCAGVLYSLTAAVPDGALRKSAAADVGALRVEGDHGFILFRGPGGQKFFMPMVQEGGHWKVAAVAASPLQ